MAKSKKSKVLNLVLCAMFAALFFVSSNIIPPVYILPGVPVTFQILLMAFMAAILGAKYSLATYGVICALTLVGVPMMSGFASGIGAFLRPSGGFIIGWIFLILCVGFYTDFIEPKIRGRKIFSVALSSVGFVAAGIVGLMLDYFCGAVTMTVYGGGGLLTNFVANIAAFTLLDTAKIVVSLVLARSVKFALGKSFRSRIAH